MVPINTSWSLTVRKFRFQSHRAVLSPRSLSLLMSLKGTIVLFFDLFGLYVNCSWSSESGGEEVMKVLTNCSKHFMMVEESATGCSSSLRRL